jgi:hypothetical protein
MVGKINFYLFHKSAPSPGRAKGGERGGIKEGREKTKGGREEEGKINFLPLRQVSPLLPDQPLSQAHKCSNPGYHVQDRGAVQLVLGVDVGTALL